MKVRIILIIGLFILLSGGATLIVFQQKKINELHTDKEQLIAVAHDSSRIATTYINSYNQVVSKNKVLELSARNAKALSDTKDLFFLKQLEGVNKNMKNLDAAVRINASIIRELKIKTVDTTLLVPKRSGDGPADTLIARSFHYTDQYNSFNGLMIGDTTTMVAKVSVPMEGAVYWKRKHQFIFKNWRFGEKIYNSELTSPNPWVEITNHEFIKVLKR